MKIKLISSSLVLAALCGNLNSWAQPETTTGDHLRDRDSLENGHQRLGKLERADKIIGMEIKDSQDQKIGKVKDLAIDLQNGRIVEVIVGTGGVLGVEERFTAVPPGQFKCDPETKTLRLDVDRERFKSSPAFKMSSWDENVRQENVREAYQYYNARPYFTSDDSSARTATGVDGRLGEVQRANKVIGSAVRNSQNEKLGKIEDLIVDLPAGRVVEVVLASGGFLGIGDELSAVPPQSFHRGIERDLLVLDTTKEALSSAPHFKSREWPDLNHPEEHVIVVYRAYNVEPYFTTSADNTTQNVRDRQDNALTPLNQGSSKSDVETSRQIRKQIMALDGLSVDARNVKIITVNGQVTLRGVVANPDEKHQIAEIAARVASKGNVDNELQVKDSSNSVK